VIEDLLQEVFLRAFSASARAAYDGVREYGPYLKAIARNRFIDLLRKRRDEHCLLSAESLATVQHSQSPEDPQDPERVVLLEDYLRTLPPALRGVYEKRFEQGLSQGAACESLALSRRSLRTLEGHLRHGVRKALIREQAVPRP
jgi:RNA polymerase sigma-70 factor (ECF subfamily)